MEAAEYQDKRDFALVPMYLYFCKTALNSFCSKTGSTLFAEKSPKLHFCTREDKNLEYAADLSTLYLCSTIYVFGGRSRQDGLQVSHFLVLHMPRNSVASWCSFCAMFVFLISSGGLALSIALLSNFLPCFSIFISFFYLHLVFVFLSYFLSWTVWHHLWRQCSWQRADFSREWRQFSWQRADSGRKCRQ